MSSAADLRSIETAQLTEFLTDQLIANLPTQDRDALAAPLKQLRETIWPNDKARKGSFDVRGDLRDPERESAYQAIIKSVDEKDRAAFMEHVAQMGHLRQLASLVARDNFFDEKYSEQGKDVPGSGNDFINNSKANVGQLLTAINGVSFNPVFTAHPTNNNTLPSMQALGEIGKAISAYRANPEIGLDALAQKVAVYAAQPITPVTAEGKDTNLNAADETTNMLHFMGEIYNQLPTTLKGYDEALRAKAEKNGEAYNPLDLAPQYKFDSWGSSGDKDGNKMVNATTTLDALLQHREKALSLYMRDLDAVIASGGASAQDRQTLTEWQDKLRLVQMQVGDLHDQLRAGTSKSGANGMLNDADFKTISTGLASAYAELDFAAFPKALESVYPNMQGQGQEKLLNLVRNTRIFGENFGRIEFRETAEEYGRVVKLLVGNDYPFLSPNELVAEKDESADTKKAREEAIDAFIGHVKSLNTEDSAKLARKMGVAKSDPKALGKLLEEANVMLEEKRTSVLTHVLEDPAKLAEIKAKLPELAEKGVQQEYGDSPYPIAYQSIKRMELARDFPQSIVKQVLAECQAPSNVLEAKLLMEAVEENGKKPVLGIVPLFEDPSLLATAHTTMKTIVENPVYAQHLKDFLAAHPDECAHTDTNDLHSPRKITQEVQFAHSDNGRRGGMPAARAYIFEAHENLQKLGDELGMSFREFHGGSASDPYRGGTRSYIGMIRDYALQDSFKLTLQGGDLLNMFNYQGSIDRYLGGVLQYCASQRLKVAELGKDHAPNGNALLVDKISRNALKNTLRDYQHRVFKNTAIGALFGALADLFELISGAVGTRKQRKGVGFEHEESREGDSTYLDPNKIRTITFSELLQHNQINPTWVGALELTNNIRSEFANKDQLPHIIQELQDMPIPQNGGAANFLTDKNRLLRALRGESVESGQKPETGDFYSAIRGINPAAIQYMYNRSPAFRDVMDRMAFGLATTNLSAVEFHHHEELDKNPQARNFLRSLKVEYVKASTLVYAAMTGKYPEAAKSEVVATRREEAIAAVHNAFVENDITDKAKLAPLQAQLKEQGIEIDLAKLSEEPGFTRETIDRKVTESLGAGDVVKDGLNLERVRDRILSLPRLNHLKRDVEDNMALLDFTNSFKDELRREYHDVDDRIPHKVEVVGGTKIVDGKVVEKTNVQLFIGDTGLRIPLETTDAEAVKEALGEPVATLPHTDERSKQATTLGGYKIRFSVDQGEVGVNYKVTLIGKDDHAMTFTTDHDNWLNLKEEVEANGLPKAQRAEIEEKRTHLFRVVHCAADTATHVYYPTAGDRLYSQARFPERSAGLAA